MPPRKTARSSRPPAVFHDAAAVTRCRVLKSREQYLQRHVAFEDCPKVIEHDHLVGIRGDQLEETHRRQMPPLVGVDFLDLLLQNGSHRVRLSRARSSVQIKARCVLMAHATDVIADDRLPPLQLHQQCTAIVDNALQSHRVHHDLSPQKSLTPNSRRRPPERKQPLFLVTQQFRVLDCPPCVGASPRLFFHSQNS
jgi:hypothetical protein